MIEWRISEDKHLQKDFVVDEAGRLIVDFVGRYETIERDFAAVCARLEIECRLPHLNSTPHRHYMTYYTPRTFDRSEEHTSELQSRQYLVCRLLLEKKKKIITSITTRNQELIK